MSQDERVGTERKFVAYLRVTDPRIPELRYAVSISATRRFEQSEIFRQATIRIAEWAESKAKSLGVEPASLTIEEVRDTFAQVDRPIVPPLPSDPHQRLLTDEA